MYKWSIDEAALKYAAHHILKLNHPVSVISASLSTMCDGKYSGYPLHMVWINKTLGHKEANLTIWHELTHALQVERDYADDPYPLTVLSEQLMESLIGVKSRRKYLRLYYEAPFEREAEKIAKKYGYKYPVLV